MPLKKLPKHIGKHHKGLASVTWKHTKAGIPDPCIKVKKGAGKVFVQNFFNPSTAFDVMIGTHTNPKKELPVHKLKRAKKVKRCLF